MQLESAINPAYQKMKYQERLIEQGDGSNKALTDAQAVYAQAKKDAKDFKKSLEREALKAAMDANNVALSHAKKAVSTLQSQKKHHGRMKTLQDSVLHNFKA